MKEQSIHESSCCRRFSLNLNTWPHWTLRPGPSTFAGLRNTGVQCSDSVFQTLLGKMLVKARNWVCWQRENNCSRKAIFISRTCFLCIVYPRLSCYSSNGLIRFIFSIYTIWNTPSLSASPRSRNILSFPLTFLRMSQADTSVPPWEAGWRHRCDRYYRCLHFAVKRGALLKASQLPKTALPPSGNQAFKCMSLWGTLPTQTVAPLWKVQTFTPSAHPSVFQMAFLIPFSLYTQRLVMRQFAIFSLVP